MYSDITIGLGIQTPTVQTEQELSCFNRRERAEAPLSPVLWLWSRGLWQTLSRMQTLRSRPPQQKGGVLTRPGVPAMPGLRAVLGQLPAYPFPPLLSCTITRHSAETSSFPTAFSGISTYRSSVQKSQVTYIFFPLKYQLLYWAFVTRHALLVLNILTYFVLIKNLSAILKKWKLKLR